MVCVSGKPATTCATITINVTFVFSSMVPQFAAALLIATFFHAFFFHSHFATSNHCNCVPLATRVRTTTVPVWRGEPQQNNVELEVCG
jgi:hypothetical protein